MPLRSLLKKEIAIWLQRMKLADGLQLQCFSFQAETTCSQATPDNDSVWQEYQSLAIDTKCRSPQIADSLFSVIGLVFSPLQHREDDIIILFMSSYYDDIIL